jgi:hypothetical protein
VDVTKSAAVGALLAASALLAAAAGPVAASAAPSGPAVPRLAGAHTFSGGPGSAQAVVTISTKISVPEGCALSSASVFSGTAAAAGLFLTSLPLNPDSRTVWITQTVGADGKRRLAESECVGGEIPPGRYLVQHVHTTGTSTWRLRFPGLKGNAWTRMTNPDASAIEELPAVLDGPASPSAHSWGTRRDLPGRGSVFTLGMLAGGLSDQGQAVFGDCLLDAAAAALPDEVAYAPGCPAGGSGLGQGSVGKETWAATITSNLPPGSYGAGFWYAGTPTSEPLGAISVWLTNG